MLHNVYVVWNELGGYELCICRNGEYTDAARCGDPGFEEAYAEAEAELAAAEAKTWGTA